jgi:hypothetical protein
MVLRLVEAGSRFGFLQPTPHILLFIVIRSQRVRESLWSCRLRVET